MISDVWSLLVDAPLYGARLRARLASPDETRTLLVALDASGSRHFLLSIDGSDPGLSDLRSRGIAVETRELQRPDLERARYIDIACLDPAGYAAFDAFGDELVKGLQAGTLPTTPLVAQTLEKWRKFWQQAAQTGLTRDQEIGLFGELWFLTYWLAPKIGYASAIGAWRGPEASRHDFESAGFSIEAKTTTIQRGIVHHISSLDQLTPPSNGPLFLFSLQLREERGAQNSLRALISILRTGAGRASASLESFEDKLARLGIQAEGLVVGNELHFRVQTEGLYRVESEFPSLRRDSLCHELPPAIENVAYSLNLAACSEYRVAQRPDAPEWRAIELP